ncbi:MAG: heavy metal-binding domain-containing protein, partial [Nitrospinota bacterium]
MRIITNLFIIFLLSSTAFANEERYTCPMHPHYISDEAGSCPICGMDLVLIEDDNEESNNSKDSEVNEG